MPACSHSRPTSPPISATIPTDVDYSQPFTASDHAAWEAEYQRNILPEPIVAKVGRLPVYDPQDALDDPWSDDHETVLRDQSTDDLDAMFNDELFDFDFQYWR